MQKAVEIFLVVMALWFVGLALDVSAIDQPPDGKTGAMAILIMYD